ncbi:MAG TPA: ATP-binding cassette domain-containing protein [Polyangiaceae bacterium]|jgi:molybdate transport system ATP-binding protein|nr:ATP-binding cassette domain-containing protein [Polyangiaceae bacterium]
MSGLVAEIGLSRGAFELSVSIELAECSLTALSGPSGAGKTTLLRCLAGLERAQRGRVRKGDAIWQDESAGVFVPPHLRGVGFVFQDTALFPHLSVRGNLEFAARRAGNRAQRMLLDAAVEWLGLAPLLERDPRTLSGGERQRVAIGRALALNPELILMDEPVAALDVEARAAILPNVERVFRELRVPVLYVTHTPSEVAGIAQQQLWLERGRLSAKPPSTPP